MTSTATKPPPAPALGQLRVGAAQLNSSASIEENLRKIEGAVNEARRKRVTVLLLPEWVFDDSGCPVQAYAKCQLTPSDAAVSHPPFAAGG